MILSVSRRTDIPAFYSEWFYHRMKEGYVLVRNPMNAHQVSRIDLSPSVIDMIVFWTKNPKELMKNLDQIQQYPYYFQFTLNGYGNQIEKHVPENKEIIETFQKLSSLTGKKRVIWRYDPILLTSNIGIEEHITAFSDLAKQLEGYTEKCVFSIVDLYRKTERNLKGLHLRGISKEKAFNLALEMKSIGEKYGITLETCSEYMGFDSIGIEHGKCIDDVLISELLNEKLTLKKDRNQREICGCVESIDIGAYHTCKHLCRYCYANYSEKTVRNNLAKHDVESPFLLGTHMPDDKITERKMVSYRFKQLSLFD